MPPSDRGISHRQNNLRFSLEKRWEILFPPEKEEQALRLLLQPFHFLGSGVQSYAFIGEDGETVLKIFKPFHMWPPNSILRHLPVPARIKNRIILEREHRWHSILGSVKIAYEKLEERTALLYLHLNRTEDQFPPIILYDKLGIGHQISLDLSAFALQKKAKLLLPYLKEHPKEGKEIINDLFDLILGRCKKGIANSDPVLWKNFGLSQGKVVEIDLGSFFLNPILQRASKMNKELLYELTPLKLYLEEQCPELLDYYHENLKKVFDAPDL